MNNYICGVAFFLSLLVLVSCNNTSADKEDQNTLNGSTSTMLGTQGNTFTPSTITIGTTGINIISSMSVISNIGGEVTVKLIVDTVGITSNTTLKTLFGLIPDSLKDASGRINTNLKFKVTTEGIQDYINMDKSPHTLIKYNAVAGDSYSLKKSSGRTLTRTVTARSDADDFTYPINNNPNWKIKTVTVEQSMKTRGVQKIVYKANHKYGIVYAEIIMEDGSSAKTYLFPTLN